MSGTRPFRFGAQVSNARSRAGWVDLARKVEDLGYSTLCMPDHFDDQLDPAPALMAAADATTTLRVGTLVLDNDFRHPVVLAKQAATLDLLTEGRLELGLGAGWLRSDYEASGIPFDTAGTRIDRFEEGLTVMKGLFAGEAFSFTGKHYTVTNLVGTPAPVQRPHPPIVIGAGAKRMLGVAARHAGIVNVNFDLSPGAVSPEVGASGTAEATAAKIDVLRQAAGDRFDDLELGTTVFFAAVTDDREPMAEGVGGAFGVPGDVVLQVPHVVFGTVDQIVEDLQRRREQFGFSYIVFGGGSYQAMAPIVAKLAGT
jgi:probable F420-dependent oxidoreductase